MPYFMVDDQRADEFWENVRRARAADDLLEELLAELGGGQ